MTRKTRWVLFCIAVCIFVALSYIMVMFSLGYKYDFSTWRFVRTGSLQVIGNTSATVYLDGISIGGTSFLGNALYVGRLLPHSYRVRLMRDGFRPWDKSVSIGAGLFSDFPKIVLIPDLLTEELVASASFAEITPISDPKDRIVTFENNEVRVTWLADTNYQPFHREGDTEIVEILPQKIDDVQWYKDHNHLFVQSGGILSFVEIDTRGGITSYPLASFTGPFLYDEDTDSIYFFRGAKLFRFTLSS